jgi:hypothetical protein
MAQLYKTAKQQDIIGQLATAQLQNFRQLKLDVGINFNNKINE